MVLAVVMALVGVWGYGHEISAWILATDLFCNYAYGSGNGSGCDFGLILGCDSG